MSTRHTLVCLPPLDDPKEWAAAIDEAIEPYGDDIYSWTAFERYDTHFIIQPNMQLLTGDAVQSPRAYGTLRCSGGRRAFLDFDAMREWRAGQATDLFDAWKRATRYMAPAVPLSDFRALHPQAPYLPQAKFRAQPQIQVLEELDMLRSRPKDAEAVALVALDRDSFIARAQQRAVPGDLLLTLDGTLHTNPAFVNADDDAETGSTRYLELANTYLDELPPDHLVLGLDCRLAG
ncbi:hypothetical protein [Streptomyces sp. NBC_00582]|uniref:hypothetical protein n=1 Tax=Streptomyces sp. NBC_00582 TaxID=2975783 RepID=UPI002E806BB3|nr:hypothetical protein [Streptomyces sp. NBC_00582]WUB68530.1 hypothetical protein OG852_50425 [Streptomyces sp. NBC_00582]